MGSAVKVGDKTLTLLDPERGLITEVPWESIRRIETGRRFRKTKKGTIIGLGVGVVLGLGFSSGKGSTDDLCGIEGCASGDRFAAAFAFGVTGAGWGALIGYLRKGEAWSEVPRNVPKISLRKERGGGSVRLAISF